MNKRAPALVAACLLLLTASLTVAQSGAGHDLTWNTVDGGGATFSTSASYSLGGTVGQPDAASLSGGDFAFVGGFWCTSTGRYVFLPVVMRNS